MKNLFLFLSWDETVVITCSSAHGGLKYRYLPPAVSITRGYSKDMRKTLSRPEASIPIDHLIQGGTTNTPGLYVIQDKTAKNVHQCCRWELLFILLKLTALTALYRFLGSKEYGRAALWCWCNQKVITEMEAIGSDVKSMLYDNYQKFPWEMSDSYVLPFISNGIYTTLF